MPLSSDDLTNIILALKSRCVAPKANGNLIAIHEEKAVEMGYLARSLKVVAGGDNEGYEPIIVAGNELIKISRGDPSVLEAPDPMLRGLLEAAIGELEDALHPPNRAERRARAAAGRKLH